MFSRFRHYFLRIPGVFRNAFFLTALGFLIWMLFFDENNILNQWQRKKELRVLEEKRHFYESEIEKVSKQDEEISTNHFTQEKYARENFLMKRDSEDVFVIVTEKYKR